MRDMEIQDASLHFISILNLERANCKKRFDGFIFKLESKSGQTLRHLCVFRPRNDVVTIICVEVSGSRRSE